MTVTQVSTVNFDSTGGDSGGAVFKYVGGGTTGDVYARAISRLPVGGYTVVFARWVNGRYEEVDRIEVAVTTPVTRVRVSLPVE